MKISHFTILISLLLSSIVTMSQTTGYPVVKVMSWNIRYDNPDDGINNWSNRRHGVIKFMKETNADIIGLQESLNNQSKDIKKGLKVYNYIGVGRDDGKKRGEFCSIFYNKKRFKLINSGTFWLSETPDVAGSRGWDAACNRIVSWAQLLDRQSSEKFFVFNTHFDHVGEVARVESARLLVRRISEIATDIPFVVTGDFNANHKDQSYRILTFPENEVVMRDTRNMAEVKEGPEFSWVSFDPSFIPTDIIDFIFASYNSKPIKHTIYDFRATQYLSDHLPVIVELNIR